jgi:hypothetical protein
MKQQTKQKLKATGSLCLENIMRDAQVFREVGYLN